MHLPQAGVDIAVIALWLGHESIETTHGYIEADLRMKELAPRFDNSSRLAVAYWVARRDDTG